MNLKVIACKVLYREISMISADLPNLIDVTYLRQGYHNTPDLLRATLQAEIDAIDSGTDPHTVDTENIQLDAILLAYGLCSNGVAGIKSKKYPIVVPRGHDCITLLLGSKEKYQHYFDTHRGVYWYTKGWIEQTVMPGKERYESIYQEYVSKYGEENAKYLIEMEQGWLGKYEWATFIDWPQFDNSEQIQYTKKCAEFLNWNFDVQPGDDTLLRDFLSGNWDDERFLIVPPGCKITPTHDDKIIGACCKGQCDNSAAERNG